MQLEFYALLLVFAPLLAAAFVGLNTRWLRPGIAQIITCVFVVASAICSMVLFQEIALNGQHIVHIHLLRWFDIGGFIAYWSIYIDVLTAVMLVVVTGVSALVHIYSVGYMSHDEHKSRFMSYLSLFTFCMIMLVTADNLIQLFFGWEGVGLSSYLLIGFWFKKDSANAAAIKAFLVNRVGDFGFALGIFLAFYTFGSVEFNSIFWQAEEVASKTFPFMGMECSMVTMVCLLLFIGCMGKSAQIGLHTWLPDAMEGPTPVSALIHAATMVTAGVFFTARLSPLFEYSPTALAVVAIIGGVTCIFAASIALVQNDIKRVIAYSTCSQLGYMFFAAGASAYSAAIFHLMTHGFFKALLFLGAGSVIHAMSDEQDMRKMGGIWKKIPFTYAMMWIGSLALAGIPLFSGYYSKDIILEAAYASNNWAANVAFWLGLLAALFTAFYSWRLLIMTFHGKPRASEKVMAHVHESPVSMTFPLLLLAIGAIVGGYVGAVMFGMVDSDHNFWRDSIFVLEHNNSLEEAHHVPLWVKLSPLVVGIIGILAAYLIYFGGMEKAKQLKARFGKVYNLLLNKWYIDEIYDVVFIKSCKKLGDKLWRIMDAEVIDGMPNGSASLTRACAKVISRMQSGYIYQYAIVMIVGVIALLTWSLIGV